MKNRIYAVIIISFSLGLIYLIIAGNIEGSDIDKNGKIIIGKYVARDKWGKYRSNYFSYYVGKEKHKSGGGVGPIDFYKNIGKFYKIKYLDKYPEAIHPLYEQEVTDTAEILNAGFSMDDILNKKENNLFP